MRGWRMFLFFFAVAVPLAAGDGAVPRSASLVLRFQSVRAFRSSLLQLLSLQSPGAEAEGTLGRWGSVIRQKTGFSLFSPEGWKRLGLDPRKPFAVALSGKKSEVFLLSAVVAPGGLRMRRFSALLRAISGYSGKIAAGSYYRMRVLRFSQKQHGFALRAGLYKNRILITNHHDGIRAGYSAILFKYGGYYSVFRTPFAGAPFCFSVTPHGLNGLFRYQLPYDEFFQNHPLSGFFRRIDGGMYPEQKRISFRIDTAGARDFYLLQLKGLLYPGYWKDSLPAVPLDISLNFLRTSAFSLLFSRLPERMKTEFYIWVIRMRRKYGIRVVRDIIGSWNGKFRFILLGDRKKRIPLLGMGIRSRHAYRSLLLFLQRAGITGRIISKKGVGICQLRRSFLFLKKELYIKYRRGMVWVSTERRALRQVLSAARGKRQRFSLKLSFIPDRLAPLISGIKDKRSDLASFIKTLAAESRFRISISADRRYLNMNIIRESSVSGK